MGARGPIHQVERTERKIREEEVHWPWRKSGRGYIVQLGEMVKRHGSSVKAVATISKWVAAIPQGAGGGGQQTDGAMGAVSGAPLTKSLWNHMT